MVAGAFLLLAAAGALTRAEVGHRANRTFPTGTLLVNVVGSLALGLIVGASTTTITLVGAGALGSLTTFSSFVRDAVALVEERRPTMAVVYISITLIAGIAAAGAGLAVAGV
jgi:CrcB protein